MSAWRNMPRSLTTRQHPTPDLHAILKRAHEHGLGVNTSTEREGGDRNSAVRTRGSLLDECAWFVLTPTQQAHSVTRLHRAGRAPSTSANLRKTQHSSSRRPKTPNCFPAPMCDFQWPSEPDVWSHRLQWCLPDSQLAAAKFPDLWVSVDTS